MGLGLFWLLQAVWPLLAFSVFSFGLMIAVGVGLHRIWRYQQHRYQAQIRYEDRLARQFYALLQRRDGRMSVLEFAMYGRIDRPRAQRYLHEQAQAFGAFFERTVDGDIVYIFNLGMIFGVRAAEAAIPVAMTPAEMAWALAEDPLAEGNTEQVRSQRQSTTTSTAASQRVEAIARQIKALKAAKAENLQQHLPAETLSDGTLPTVRGRAQAAPEHIKTIDVLAVNE